MKREELALHWRTLAGSTVAASLGSMGLYLYTAGAFMPALIADQAFTKDQLALGSFVVAVCTALSAPIAGWLMDRFGAVRIIGLCFAGEVLGLMLLGLVPPRFPLFAASLAALAILGIGTAPPSFARLITARFDRMRGLALAITISGLGVLAIVGPISTTWLIQRVGWRHSYLILAALVAVVGAIGVALIRSDRRADHAAPRATPDVGGVATPDGLRRPVFWLMLAGFLIPALFGNGYLLHLITLLRERGFSPGNAAQIQAVVGVAVLVGRLGSGVALDRFSAPRVGAITFSLSALGCLLLLQSGPLLVGLAAFAIGLTIGAELDMMAYFISRYFGLASFGRLYGLAYGGILLTAGASPLLIARLDAIGGYPLALVVSAIGILLGAVILFFLPDPRLGRAQRGVTDIAAPIVAASPG